MFVPGRIGQDLRISDDATLPGASWYLGMAAGLVPIVAVLALDPQGWFPFTVAKWWAVLVVALLVATFATACGMRRDPASLSSPPVFIDVATGGAIPESDLVYGDDNTVTARNADGEVIGTVSWDDINNLQQRFAPADGEADWSAVTTAEGTTFARESVAELLGVERSADPTTPPAMRFRTTRRAGISSLCWRQPE